jgi:hypothetical protein
MRNLNICCHHLYFNYHWIFSVFSLTMIYAIFIKEILNEHNNTSFNLIREIYKNLKLECEST